MDRDTLSQKLQQDKAGFTHIRIEAENALAILDAAAGLVLARDMLASDINQDRMFAVLVLGSLAAEHRDAYQLLVSSVVPDSDWRVQEMLARAFDQYCKDRGYEQSLLVIREWLTAEHPNQRRAASEGLRIWTSRPYFKQHPEVAIQLLAERKADDSDYVRQSAGNALRDISRQFPELVRRELATWTTSDKRVEFTRRLAGKFL